MKKQLYLDYLHEFKSQYGDITIAREDYEDLMIPMIAVEFSDEQMQKLVDNINLSMRSDYDDKELGWLSAYRNLAAENGLTAEQIRFADKMSEREFEYFERCARELGMRYYEDLDDDEYEEITAEKEKN